MEAALEGSSGWAPILLAALSLWGRPGRGAVLWLCLQCVSFRKAQATFPALGRLGGCSGPETHSTPGCSCSRLSASPSPGSVCTKMEASSCTA